MKYIALALLSLCLTFAPFSAFIPVWYNTLQETKSDSNTDGENTSKTVDNTNEDNKNNKTTIENTETTVKNNKYKYVSNAGYIELFGFASIQYPTSHYSFDANEVYTESEQSAAVIRYKDNRSSIIMSYVTTLNNTKDIPGYITRELAGIDTVTNSKYEIDADAGKWMCVPSENNAETYSEYAYYILNKDSTAAFYMKVTMYNDVNTEEFNESIKYILDNYYYYYAGTSQFSTPVTGYYSDNTSTNKTDKDVEGYDKNDKNNNVYQSYTGFTKADIADNWQSLEMIIGGKKFKPSITVKDLKKLGYRPVETIYTDDYWISDALDINFINSDNIIIHCRMISASGESVQLQNASIVYTNIIINELPQDKQSKADIIILPGGVCMDIYTNDLIDKYGQPDINESDTSSGSVVKKYTWIQNNSALEINIGVISNIKEITIYSNYYYKD